MRNWDGEGEQDRASTRRLDTKDPRNEAKIADRQTREPHLARDTSYPYSISKLKAVHCETRGFPPKHKAKGKQDGKLGGN